MAFTRGALAQLPMAVRLFLIVWAGMVYWNFHALESRLTPESDLAADMLLVDLIRAKGYLLLGHYSRWGFNHPGPFWLYLSYCFEKLLANSNLWRFQIWLWGHVLVSSSLITVAAIALSNYLLGRCVFGFVLFFAATLIGFFGVEMNLLWMPWRLVLPYLCFLLAILYLAEGYRPALLISVFSTGTLIHGYMTMPLFTVPLLLLALWLGHRQTQWLSAKGAGTYLWWALGLTILFASPLLLDTLWATSSNLMRVVNAQIAFRSMPKPSLSECIAFAESLLRIHENRWGWLASLSLLSLVPIWRTLSEQHRRGMGRIFLLCGIVTFLVLGYYPQTPAPLYPFVAQFYVAIPVLFLTTLGSIAFQPQVALKRKSSGLSLARFRIIPPLMVALAFVSTLGRSGFGSPGEEIRQLSHALASYRSGQEVSLNLPDQAEWHTLTGLILELSRLGIPACTIRGTLAHIVTPQHVCAADRFPDVELIQKDQCRGACFAEYGSHGLRPFRLAVTNLEAPLGSASDDTAFISWTRSPESTWWSNSPVSQILLNISNPESLEGVLELGLNALWPQRIKVLWNGHVLLNQRKGSDREFLKLKLAREWILVGGNVISFVLPRARQPGNGDLRDLAIVVDNVRVR